MNREDTLTEILDDEGTLLAETGASSSVALAAGSRSGRGSVIQEDNVKLTTYRLFWTNGSGRIASVPDTVDAYDDDEAVQEAEKMAQGRKVEVWERSRQVASLNGSERR